MGTLFNPTSDKIEGFLSTFVGEDLTRGLADLDLDGDDTHTRTKGLKYMDQLVRLTLQSSRAVRLKWLVATYCQPGTTNVGYRPRGHCRGSCDVYSRVFKYENVTIA